MLRTPEKLERLSPFRLEQVGRYFSNEARPLMNWGDIFRHSVTAIGIAFVVAACFFWRSVFFNAAPIPFRELLLTAGLISPEPFLPRRRIS